MMLCVCLQVVVVVDVVVENCSFVNCMDSAILKLSALQSVNGSGPLSVF